MSELSDDERKLLELMKREEARQDAQPESERAHTSRPERFSGPIGADDEGRMFQRTAPPASKEETDAHYRELIAALEEKEAKAAAETAGEPEKPRDRR